MKQIKKAGFTLAIFAAVMFGGIVFLFSAEQPVQQKKATGPAQSKQITKTPVEIALDKLASDNPAMRRQGIEELARLREPKAEVPLVKLLEDKDAGVRRAAVDALGMLRSRKALDKIGKLLLEDKNLNVRHAAAIALSYIGDRKAGKFLLEALNDKTPSVRYAVLRTIGTLKYKAAEEKIVSFLKSKDVNTVRAAISTLGRLNVKSSAGKIARLAKKSKDMYVKIEAARALGEIRDKEYIPVLKDLLDDEKPRVALEAAHALAKMKDNTGIKVASRYIESSDVSLLQPALNVISLVGDKSSLAILDKALEKQKNPNLKAFINFAKGRLLSRLKISKPRNVKEEKQEKAK